MKTDADYKPCSVGKGSSLNGRWTKIWLHFKMYSYHNNVTGVLDIFFSIFLAGDFLSTLFYNLLNMCAEMGFIQFSAISTAG